MATMGIAVMFHTMFIENSLANHQPHPAPEKPVSAAAWRILVVDDEPFIRSLGAEVLARAGYRVETAENGAIAWDMLQSGHYDLLVTDNDMPELTGVDLLKRLHFARLTLPVILVTGRFPYDEFERHPWIQPAVTLLKPFGFEELLSAVQTVSKSPHGVPVGLAGYFVESTKTP